ncbi:MAG: ATP/GTP-binding protein [Crenarchaeota archaeon]|nr:ATP/GTP-binding protein [Thermoproteota archaeon]
MNSSIPIQHAQVVYIMGFAGSGKSTLVSSFAEYLSERKFSVACVNLDPGAEVLPYKPDYDVRSVVKLVDVMRKERLGPNGGLIRAVEIITNKITEIVKPIQKLAFSRDWLLIDTTGQLELFAFRELGETLIRMLNVRSIGVYLVDASMISKPSDVVLSQLISLAIRLRLGIDIVVAINKIDAERVNTRELMEEFLLRVGDFKERLRKENLGVLTDLTYDLVDFLISYFPPARIITISAKNKTGFDDLYSILHEIFCVCGDLT